MNLESEFFLPARARARLASPRSHMSSISIYEISEVSKQKHILITGLRACQEPVLHMEVGCPRIYMVKVMPLAFEVWLCL